MGCQRRRDIGPLGLFTHGGFNSADSSWKCRGCHLDLDMCNYPPEKKLNLLRVLGGQSRYKVWRPIQSSFPWKRESIVVGKGEFAYWRQCGFPPSRE